MVENGPNKPKNYKQTNKDKYKDQVGHDFDFCFFFGFLLHAEKYQNVPKHAKKCQTVPKSPKKN